MNGFALLTLTVAAWYHDPSLAQQVANLDAPAFRTREHAEVFLRRAGARAVPLLQRVNGSIEARRRAGRLVQTWRRQRNERWLARHGQLPWIDLLDLNRFGRMEVPELLQARFIPTESCHDPCSVVQTYYSQASQVTGPDYLQYREATRLYVQDLLDAGVNEQQIDDMLRMMAPLEQRWRDAYEKAEKPDA